MAKRVGDSKAQVVSPQQGQRLVGSAPVEAAWTAELRVRLEDVRNGEADLTEWAEARAQIHGSRQ